MSSIRINGTGFPSDGKEVSLPTEGKFVIGRDSASQIVLPHQEVSRRHAEILCAPGHYQLANCSRAGTVIGEVKIQEIHNLKHGDVIRIGPASLTFLDAHKPQGETPQAIPASSAQSDSKTGTFSSQDGSFAVPERLYADDVITLKNRIHEKVLEKLNLREIASKETQDSEMRAKMEEALDRVMRDVRHEIPQDLSPDLLRRAMLDELIAYGPITPMLNDPTVTEVMVNGAGRIFVEQDKLKETRARFYDDRHLMAVIRRIVEPLGRRVDESSPRVDARLPDGSRVNAIIPPIALDGPSLTIRKFPERKLTVEDLVGYGSLTAPMAKFLEEAVRAKQNIVVSGGTGSGKTTLLNVLSQFIPADERIVTIEDSAELRLTHRNLVRLEARPPNIEGKGRVTIQDLVINALRMRPDRIVVGECRGAEALDMLQAMNTGHDGSLTTVHANTPRDSLSRMETMVMMAGYDLPSRAIRDQISAAVHLIVQQTRFVDHSRRIEKISEITGREGDIILMQDIFVFEQSGFDARGKVAGRFKATGNKPRFVEELRKKGDLRLDMSVFKAET
jgi:pilus assembly protein CpaF